MDKIENKKECIGQDKYNLYVGGNNLYTCCFKMLTSILHDGSVGVTYHCSGGLDGFEFYIGSIILKNCPFCGGLIKPVDKV